MPEAAKKKARNGRGYINAEQVLCPFETAELFMTRQLADREHGCAYIDREVWLSTTVRLMSIRSLIQFGFQVGLLVLDEETIQAIIMAIKTAFSGGQLSMLQEDADEGEQGPVYFPRDIHSTLALIVLWCRRWYEKGLYKDSNFLPVISTNGTSAAGAVYEYCFYFFCCFCLLVICYCCDCG